MQWGTVRMLGVFLTDDPLAVPPETVAFVAEQLGLDPAHLADYGQRQQTVYEHAWEIRELLDYRAFGSCESEVRQYVAARVWASAEGPRALFDRAQVHMLKERILLPGMTVLVRMIGEVRRAENERLHALLSGRLPAEMRAALVGLLEVPDGKRRSELERLRTAPTKASGRVLADELRRVAEIAQLGAGGVATDPVPAVKLGALARYGLAAKAPRSAPRSPSCGADARRRPGTATAPPSPPGCSGARPRSTGPPRPFRLRPNAARRTSTRPARSPRPPSTGCCPAATSRCARRRCGGCSTKRRPERLRSWR